MRAILRRILPRQIKIILRYWIDFPSRYLPVLFQRNEILSSFYYALFSRRFGREHKAVLAGQIAYKKKLTEIGESCTLLRRNIHRLEKGLIMQPRRAVFAEQYILETVECMDRAHNVEALCPEEKKWCIDVLNEYFSIVERTPTIKKAQSIFSRIKTSETEIDRFIPYSYSSLPSHNITFEELNKLFARRRSVRWYQEKQVPMALIERAIDIATLAPSACNRQPYQFYVSSDRNRAVEIAKHAIGTRGFAENLQCLITVVGDLSAYPKEQDRHLIYIDGGLVSMQLMLALETQGLASCPINWPDLERNEREIQKILSLKVYQRVVMLIAVGYAEIDGGIPYSQKKKNNILMKVV